MVEIVFRKLNKSDLPYLKSMLTDIWEIERFTAGNQILANHIISSILYADLINHNYSEIALCDHRVVGILLARIGNDKEFHPLWKLKEFYHSLCLKISRNNRNLQEYEKVNKSFKKLLANRPCASELIFFMMASSMRGQGVGKSLITHYFDKCSSQDIHEFCLVTDTQCNYEYYNKAGFTLEAHESFPVNLSTGEVNHETFLYTYKP